MNQILLPSNDCYTQSGVSCSLYIELKKPVSTTEDPSILRVRSLNEEIVDDQEDNNVCRTRE